MAHGEERTVSRDNYPSDHILFKKSREIGHGSGDLGGFSRRTIAYPICKLVETIQKTGRNGLRRKERCQLQEGSA